MSEEAPTTAADAFDALEQIADEAGEVADETEQRALDIAAADYSDYEGESVSAAEAALDAEQKLVVTEEQFKKFREGKVTREELGAREDDEITTIKRDQNLITKLFTPRTRAVLLDEWMTFGSEPVTITEVSEMTDQVTRQAAYTHVDALVEYGIVSEAGNKGNATAYRLNIHNPIVQCLEMLSSIGRFGKTKLLLERDFLVPGPDGEGLSAPEMEANDGDNVEE